MLITHFQVALKGAVPFTFNWEGVSENDGSGSHRARAKGRTKKKTNNPVAEARERAGMDAEGVIFMQKLCILLRSNGESKPGNHNFSNTSSRTKVPNVTGGGREK